MILETGLSERDFSPVGEASNGDADIGDNVLNVVFVASLDVTVVGFSSCSGIHFTLASGNR